MCSAQHLRRLQPLFRPLGGFVHALSVMKVLGVGLREVKVERTFIH